MHTRHDAMRGEFGREIDVPQEASAEGQAITPSQALEIGNRRAILETFDPKLHAASSSMDQSPLLALLEECIKEEGLQEEGFQQKTLIKEGQRLEECYLIRAGADVHIKKVINHPDGPVKLRVAVRKPPVVVGEISFLTDGVASATVDCTGPVRLVRIPKKVMDAMMEKHSELFGSLSDLGVTRLEEQVHLVSQAEDAILEGGDRKAHRQLIDAFDYSRALAAWEKANVNGPCEIATVTLHGVNRLTREAIPEEFTISAEFDREQNAMAVTHTKHRRFVPQFGFLPRRWRETETIQHVFSERPALRFTITSTQGADISFSLYKEGEHVRVDLSDLQKAGLENHGFLTQIYHAAFHQAQRIDTSFAEEHTLDYLHDRKNETACAPSVLAAHSPVVAARKGFVTTIGELSEKNATALSDRIDPEVEDILDVLTNLERDRIDPSGPYGAAHRTLSQLYPDPKHTAHKLLTWAEEALNSYLAQPRDTPLSARVQHLLELQQKRNKELQDSIKPSKDRELR